MEYLQVPDAHLRRAVAGLLEKMPQAPFAVREEEAPAKLAILDGLCVASFNGEEIEKYALPIRLPAVMADLVWFFTRRAEQASREIRLSAGYILYPHEFKITLSGLSTTLTGREVALLQFMVRAGECSKELLLSEVWNYHPDADTHTIETHLWRLRQKLTQAGMEAPLIVTTDAGYTLA